ncbi:MULTISPECIES: hypothetical protein [Lactobacillaceae]|uniref:hypothetical protein n=1 Tax=Lactobacillaceae TaxID=33958 RepID=UPI0008636710|nr:MULTISPECIES: hypothetical protein [Lactobacillaceae]MBO2714934.1 hypothetical protein [Lactiplantibacillus plantarum]MCG0758392.1 hypothetical protein [Lactiplantibacillus plantarum]MCG0775674.1 hypothetical protein [Lactiplantibacillus plantarum]MCG0868584.1 hypothetical protein [Lactiplantibacillus plantarum]MCT3035784.1 hypothetical protein [Pediococcus parvulus]
MVTFNDVLKQICVLFSKNIGETVVSSQVGFESIKLAREEIDYKGVDIKTLPEWVLVHMFICGDWSGYAVVNLAQTKLYGLGTFYFDEEPFRNGR